jgi:hypothetical protein
LPDKPVSLQSTAMTRLPALSPELNVPIRVEDRKIPRGHCRCTALEAGQVNDANHLNYEERGMERFRPFEDKPLWSMT